MMTSKKRIEFDITKSCDCSFRNCPHLGDRPFHAKNL